MAKIIKFSPRKKSNSDLFDFLDMPIAKLLEKAESLYRSRDYKEATKLFKEVIETIPDSYSALFHLGNIYLNTQNIGAAINYYKRAIKVAPDRNYFCYINLMNALLIGRQYSEVLSVANDCLKIFPNKSETIKLQGISSFHLKKFHFSLDFLRKYFEKYPNDKECLYYLGAIYQNFGMLDAALYYYERLLRISSDDLEIKKILGILYSHIGKFRKAAKFLEEYFSLSNDFSISNELIFVFTNLEEYDNALLILKKISSQTINNPKIYLSMVELYLLKNDTSSALKALKNAYIVNSKDPEILFDAASYYVQLNKTDTAIYLFKKCISENPEFIPAYSSLFKIYETIGDIESYNSLKIGFLHNKQNNEDYFDVLKEINKKN